MSKRLTKTADSCTDAKASIIKINKLSDDMNKIYFELFTELNNLYDQYPNVYKEIEKTVKLPTNDDASDVTEFNSNLKQELEYFNDDKFLKSVIDGNPLDSDTVEQEDTI